MARKGLRALPLIAHQRRTIDSFGAVSSVPCAALDQCDASRTTASADRQGTASGTRSAGGSQTAPAAPPARDFLEELERQRTDAVDPDVPRVRDTAAEPVAVPARTVGEPPARKATSYDADDLEIPSFLRRR